MRGLILFVVAGLVGLGCIRAGFSTARVEPPAIVTATTVEIPEDSAIEEVCFQWWAEPVDGQQTYSREWEYRCEAVDVARARLFPEAK